LGCAIQRAIDTGGRRNGREDWKARGFGGGTINGWRVKATEMRQIVVNVVEDCTNLVS